MNTSEHETVRRQIEKEVLQSTIDFLRQRLNELIKPVGPPSPRGPHIARPAAPIPPPGPYPVAPKGEIDRELHAMFAELLAS